MYAHPSEQMKVPDGSVHQHYYTMLFLDYTSPVVSSIPIMMFRD